MLSIYMIYLYGALVVILIGFTVGPLLNCIASFKNVKPPVNLNTNSSNDLKAIVFGSTIISKSGIWIGRLESFIFYISFLHFEESAVYVIGGWLAFKVASKWETWNNIHKVPVYFKGIDENEFFKFRRVWGDTVYERFIIGTLFNIFIGFFAYLFVQFLQIKEVKMFIYNNWITIVCSLVGVLASFLITRHFYKKSIYKYKTVINKDLLERIKSNWGHFNEINNNAVNLPSGNEKDLIIKHSANGLVDAGYIDGVINKLLDQD